MKPASIILNWKQKGNLWNGTVLIFLEEKFRKVSISRQGYDHCFSEAVIEWFLWMLC
jgi:hypothetical protein